MIHYLTIFVAGFLRVFFAGVQSRNVNTGRRRAAMATSMAIALSEGTIIAQLAIAPDWGSRIAYGLSGAAGIWCAMVAHDWAVQRADTK